MAAALPVPTVYLLEREEGINAFVAGSAAESAVLCVTRGALDLLTRDELQAVVAHELSHVVNGDMALNARLAVQLQGLIVFSEAGRKLVNFGFGRGDDKGQSSLVGLLGLAIMGVGAVGGFFGSLFMGAVSGERELLADAEAIQFTRNPAALLGAFKKIGGPGCGGEIKSAELAEVSNFLFVEPSDALGRNPFLLERIRALEPDFDGRFPTTARTARWTASFSEPAMNDPSRLLLAGLLFGAGCGSSGAGSTTGAGGSTGTGGTLARRSGGPAPAATTGGRHDRQRRDDRHRRRLRPHDPDDRLEQPLCGLVAWHSHRDRSDLLPDLRLAAGVVARDRDGRARDQHLRGEQRRHRFAGRRRSRDAEGARHLRDRRAGRGRPRQRRRSHHRRLVDDAGRAGQRAGDVARKLRPAGGAGHARRPVRRLQGRRPHAADLPRARAGGRLRRLGGARQQRAGGVRVTSRPATSSTSTSTPTTTAAAIRTSR